MMSGRPIKVKCFDCLGLAEEMGFVPRVSCPGGPETDGDDGPSFPKLEVRRC